MPTILRTVGPAFRSWREDNASRLGAALAYYTVLSLPGLLLLLVGIAGILFGRDAVAGRVVHTLSGLMGTRGAELVQQVLRSTATPARGGLVAAIGTATLLLGGLGVFASLQDALNTVWEVKATPRRGLRSYLRRRLLSLATLLGLSFLLVVSLGVNAVIASMVDRMSQFLPGGPGLWQAVNLVLSLGILTLLFALMFKYLPDVLVRWRDVLVGALLTAALFTAGEWLIGIYVARTNVGSAYGAAGSVVIVLVWLYYSSQILLFGAEYTKAWAHGHGGVQPRPGAEAVTEDARAQQGIPRDTRPAA